MFKRLKEKWGVNNLNFALILLTFALGGSLCGYLGRTLLAFLGIEKGNAAYMLLYIIAMTLLWPLSVISVSILTGQFKFFKNYLKKIARRFTGKN